MSSDFLSERPILSELHKCVPICWGLGRERSLAIQSLEFVVDLVGVCVLRHAQ